MRFTFFLSSLLVGSALSSPARRDCGQERCYDAVNECGMTYGGCWTQCADGIKDVPTFTAPSCPSSINTAVTADAASPTQTPNAVHDIPSSTSDGTAESLITPPPACDATKIPNLKKKSTCSALWLCVDYMAVCGDSTRMYGGCYDVCTSAPPVSSPPCSLSSSASETGYATSVPTPKPGVAYTKKPASDDITPATDDNKAMVMAEMPNVDTSSASEPLAATPVPFIPNAGEFRMAHVQTDNGASGSSDLVEAPASLRGQAIAKVAADTERKPYTENKPCWDHAWCKEVQLGIPQPSPVESSAEPTEQPTAEPSVEAPPETTAEAPAEPPAEAPAETTTEAPAETPADSPEESTEAPAEPSVI